MFFETYLIGPGGVTMVISTISVVNPNANKIEIKLKCFIFKNTCRIIK